MRRKRLLYLAEFIIAICACLLSNYCHAQNKSIDSLLKLLPAHKPDTHKVNTLNSLASQYIRQKDYPKALSIAGEALSLSSQLGFSRGAGHTYYSMAQANAGLQRNSEALENYQLSLQHFQKAKAKRETAWAAFAIGQFHLSRNNSEGLKYLTEAVAMYKELGDFRGQFAGNSTMAVFFSRQENHGDAIRYHYLVLKAMEKIGDRSMMASVLLQLGSAQLIQGNTEEALKSLLQARDYFRETNTILGLGQISRRIGDIYAGQGRLTESLQMLQESLKIYKGTQWEENDVPFVQHSLARTYEMMGDRAKDIQDAQKNYTIALTHNGEAMASWEKSRYGGSMSDAYIRASQIYLKLGDRPKSKMFLDKAMDLSRRFGRKSNIREAYFIQSKLDSLDGRFRDAYENYKNFITYRDSLQNEETTRKTVQAKYAYEFGKKEDSLNLLQQLSNEKLKQQELIALQQLQELQLQESALKISNQQKELNQLAYLKAEAGLQSEQIQRQENEKRLLQSEKEAAFQQANLKLKNAELANKESEIASKKTERNFLVAGAVALLIGGLVLLRNNRNKQKAYTLLAKQKQETDRERNNVERAMTDLRTMQSQLVQSEKMASLGELTAGIAHEIQNPLNFVNNFSEVNLELVEEMTEQLEIGNKQIAKEIAGDLKHNLEKISHHGKRADGIVKSMLQHSRKSSGQKEPTDINNLVDEYLRLSYHGLRAKDKNFNAILETHFDPSVGKMTIAGQDIGRVFLNLFNNAFYAVNQKMHNGSRSGNGKYEPVVQVSTRRGDAGGVEVRVKDNGVGIPAAVLEKIYQPFFTTKPTGEGTGLGLSLSYDIITKGHGGSMKVESKEGEGAEFTIVIPD